MSIGLVLQSYVLSVFQESWVTREEVLITHTWVVIISS